MWRTEGAGEIYDYLPVSYTGTDDGYGESSKYHVHPTTFQY